MKKSTPKPLPPEAYPPEFKEWSLPSWKDDLRITMKALYVDEWAKLKSFIQQEKQNSPLDEMMDEIDKD